MSEKIDKDWKKVRQQQEELIEDVEYLEEESQKDEDDTSTKALDNPGYEELEAQLTAAEQKAHTQWEQLMRAQAELDNVRRRAEREIANAHRYGLDKFLDSLLPVVDSLEQALQVAQDGHDKSMREGIELTMKLFLDVLRKNDVQQIDPLGEAFNPQEHEAMSVQESKDFKPDTVVTVFQKGYKLHDRIIRPARVIVAK